MPLLDHFEPPLSRSHPWRSFHGAWAATIARLLNQGVLPPGYYAVPFVDRDGPVEIDVTTLRERRCGTRWRRASLRRENMLRAKFATLRQLFFDLGFTMQADARRVRFDHAETKTWFLFPPYDEDEEVTISDLVGTRYALDMKGFLPRDQFEERLRRNLVAG